MDIKVILECVLKNINNNDVIDQKDWISCMVQDKLEDRILVNKKLADAFLEKSNFRQASIHAERAWIFSGFQCGYAKYYISILEKLNSIDKIMYVYKQTGMAEARRNNFEQAINFFNKSLYAKATYMKKDIYDYDFDILYKIEEIAQKFVFESKQKAPSGNVSKTKIGYLTYGIADVGSVFAKFIPLFAKYHNKEKFEVVFFVPEREEQIYSKEHSLDVVQKIEKFGCRVVCALNEKDRFKRWLSTGKRISEYNPDIFITFAALSRFEYYFIASTLPKHIKKVALVYGPPAQYTPITFDVAIGNSNHPLMDTPLDIYNTAPILFENKKQDILDSGYDKKYFNISDDRVVMVSVGRHTKFQDPLFWDIIKTTLKTYQHSYFICVGSTFEEVCDFGDLDKEELKKIKFLGWRTDVDKILDCADIYVNTFPNGGGHTIKEAIEKKIPVISFKNNYFEKFDQNNWNPIEDFMDVEDMLIPHGNKEVFVRQLGKLIVDKDFRKKMGLECFESLNKKIPSPQSAMAAYEKTLKMILS